MLREIFGFIGSFVRGAIEFFTTQWRQFNPIGQALFALALVMIAVDATISFKFGMSQTWAHAIGFAGLAVAFFLLPDAAVTEWRKGNKAGGLWLGVSCVPIGLVCLWTHVGYSSGVRLGDIEQSGFSNASYNRADTALGDKRKTLSMLQDKHKLALEKSAAALTRNQGWTISVDPKAMESSLAALDKKIENEAARVRCAKKCEDLKVERGQLAAAIALAKEENDISEKISALEKDISDTVGQVAALTPKTSTTVSQVQMAAKLVNTVAYYTGLGTEEAVLRPSAFQQDLANTAAAGASSIAFLLVSTTLMTGAGFNRKRSAIMPEHAPATPVSQVPAVASTEIMPRTAPQQPAVNLQRSTMGDAARAKLARMLEAGDMRQAA